MLLLLSSPEKEGNPVIAASTRQWTFNDILFETAERCVALHPVDTGWHQQQREGAMKHS